MNNDDINDAPEGATAGRPVVRLKPKAEARAIRHGFPWIYSDELVTDRRTSGLEPGALAVLEDGDRRPLGLVTVNVKSKIIARMLDRDPAAQIDEVWFTGRLSRALDMRTRLYDAPHYRWVHAEADGLPGIVIDRFGDVAVVQPNAAWAETLIALGQRSEAAVVLELIELAARHDSSLAGLRQRAHALLELINHDA